MCEDSSNKKIDTCMKDFIFRLNQKGIITLGCCCGHGIYPMTIVTKDDGGIFELISGKEIPRKKRFYIKDKGGFYYIPEVTKK